LLNLFRNDVSQSDINFFWMKLKRAWIYIHKHRMRPDPDNRAGRSKKAKCCSDDAVAGLNSRRDQRQPKRVRAGSAAHRRRYADECSDFALEFLDFSSEDELL